MAANQTASNQLGLQPFERGDSLQQLAQPATCTPLTVNGTPPSSRRPMAILHTAWETYHNVASNNQPPLCRVPRHSEHPLAVSLPGCQVGRMQVMQVMQQDEEVKRRRTNQPGKAVTVLSGKHE